MMRLPNALSCLLLMVMCITESQAQRPESFHESVQKMVVHDETEILIENVRLIDGTGSRAKKSVSVYIRDGRIAAFDDEPESDDMVRIDGEGKTLMPGYVMFHEHLLYPNPRRDIPNYTSEPLAMTPLYLAAGATTIRTGGTLHAYHDLRVKAMIAEGRWAGPDIHITAPFIEGQGSFAYQLYPQLSATEVREFVRYWVAQGATSFKAYMNVSREVLAAAIDEAHKLDAIVTGHLCSITFAEASALGIDNLEHGLMVASDLTEGKQAEECKYPKRADMIELMDVSRTEVQSLIQTLVRHDVAITSTLPVFAAGVHPSIPTQAALDLLSPRSRAAKQANWIQLLSAADSEPVKQRQQQMAREMAFEKAFVEAGGTLLVGTDPTGWGGTIPPNATHAALMLLVEAGFTPLEVISLATLNGARYLGVDDEIGSIAVGKRANLILIDGRPDEQIADVQKVALVFRDGVAYDPAALIDSVRGTLGR